VVLIPDSEKAVATAELQAIERLREVVNGLGITQEPMGFVNRTDSTISVAAATGVVTIAPAVTSYDYYFAGLKVTKTGADTSATRVGEATGTYYVYFDSAGVLQVDTDFFDLSSCVPVAIVYWELATTRATMFDERHGCVMDWATHQHLHTTFGARYVSGLAGTFADATFSVDGGAWADEDIMFSFLVAKTTCHQWFRDGAGGWTRRTASPATAYYDGAAGSITYDDGDGTLAAVGANKYVAMWVFTTSDPVTPIHVILGQREDTTLALARANATFAALDLAGLPSPEWVPLYRVILRNDATPYEETSDLRTQVAMPAGAYTPAQHSALAGRSAADSHPASAIGVDASAFLYALSVADTSVQAALATLDGVLNFDSILSVNGAWKGVTFFGSVDSTGGVASVLAQAADFHYDPADADSAATAHGLVMATGAGTGTERLLRWGMICNTAWNWVAGPVYLSNTAGEITQTAPVSGVVVPIGVALSADTIWFDPSQAEAMASSGLPASTGDGSLLYADGAGNWAEGYPLVNGEGLIVTNAEGVIQYGGM